MSENPLLEHITDEDAGQGKLPTIDDLNATVQQEKPKKEKLPTLDDLNSSLKDEPVQEPTQEPVAQEKPEEVKTQTLSNPYGLQESGVLAPAEEKQLNKTQQVDALNRAVAKTFGFDKQKAIDNLAEQKPLVDRINADPKDVQAKYDFADVLTRQGKYSQASNMYSALLAENPDDPNANYGMYFNLVHLGSDEQAKQYYDKYAELTTGLNTPTNEVNPATGQYKAEEDRLRPYQQRLSNALLAIQSLPVISTIYQAPHMAEEAIDSFKKSGEAFADKDYTKGALKAVEGGMHAMILAGTATPEGLLFFESLNGLKLSGVPDNVTNAAMAPVSEGLKALGYTPEEGGKMESFLSIANLAVVGKIMHSLGKPLSELPDTKISWAEQEAKLKDNPITKNEAIATLNNLDNPSAAKIETSLLDLQDAVKQDPSLAPLMGTQVTKLQDKLVTEKSHLAEKNAEKNDIQEKQQQIAALKEKQAGQPQVVVNALQANIDEISNQLPKETKSVKDEALQGAIDDEAAYLEHSIKHEQEYIDKQPKQGRVGKLFDKISGIKRDEALKDYQQSLELLKKDPLAYYKKKLAEHEELNKKYPDETPIDTSHSEEVIRRLKAESEGDLTKSDKTESVQSSEVAIENADITETTPPKNKVQDLGFDDRKVFTVDGGTLDVAKKDGKWSVVELHVDENQRRKGVATKLMKHAIDKYGEDFAGQASNDMAIDMNYKLGMRAFDEKGEELSLQETKDKRAEQTSVNMRFIKSEAERNQKEKSNVEPVNGKNKSTGEPEAVRGTEGEKQNAEAVNAENGGRDSANAAGDSTAKIERELAGLSGADLDKRISDLETRLAQDGKIRAKAQEAKAVGRNLSLSDRAELKRAEEVQKEWSLAQSEAARRLTDEYKTAAGGEEKFADKENSSNFTSDEKPEEPSAVRSSGEKSGRSDQIGKAKNRRVGTPKSRRKIRDPRYKKALKIETQEPYDKVLQHFIGGGEINTSAIQQLFGRKGIKKSVEGERRARFGILGKNAPTIDGLAHQLWESQPEHLMEKYDTHDFRNAVEEVLLSYTGRTGMVEAMLDKFGDVRSEHDLQYANQHPGYDSDFIQQAEDIVEGMTDEQFQRAAEDKMPIHEINALYDEYANGEERKVEEFAKQNEEAKSFGDFDGANHLVNSYNKRNGTKFKDYTELKETVGDAELKVFGKQREQAIVREQRKVDLKNQISAELKKARGEVGMNKIFPTAIVKPLLELSKIYLEEAVEKGGDILKNFIAIFRTEHPEFKDVPDDVVKSELFDGVSKRSTTSIKNDQVDSEREQRGLPPMMKEAARKWGRVWDTAMQQIEQGQNPIALAEDILDKKRPASDVEGAILDYHRIDVHNQYHNAMENYLNAAKNADEVGKDLWNSELARLDQEKDLNDNAARVAGRETARGLAFRRAMVKEDYTLSEVVNKIVKARGFDITAEERVNIEKLTKDFQDKTKALEDHIQAQQEKISKLQAEAVVGEQVRQSRAERRTVSRDAIKREREDILSKIKQIAHDSRKELGSLPLKHAAELTKQIGALAKTYIAEGIIKADELVEKVHSDIKDLVAGVSLRDVRDAISGYAQEKPTRKQIDSQMADLKSQLRIISKIEDAENGVQQAKTVEQKRKISKELADLKLKLKDVLASQKAPADIENTINRKLDAYKNRLQKQLDDLNEKITNKDFSTKNKPLPVPLDEQAIKLKGAVDRAKTKLDELVENERLANRGNAQKIADQIGKWRREFILSGVHTLGKLSAYATGKSLLLTPAEEIVGGILSLPLKAIADKAPRHGVTSIEGSSAALAKSYTQWFKKETYRQAKQVALTGLSDLDRVYGGKNAIPPEMRSYMGQLHGALKVMPKQAEFWLSYEKRMRNAIDSGVDVKDPLVQEAIGGAAYKDALESILMEDNWFVKQYQNLIKEGENSTSSTAQLAAFTAKFMLPIVKIPMNYARQTLHYSPVGLIHGAAKLTKAIIKGTDNLKPEEADMIMKLMKRGMIGSGIMLIGYYNPQAFGGYYQPYEKRKEGEVKAGNIKVNGVDVPTWIVHNPVLEALQLGATIRRVADKKRKGQEQGLGQGIARGFIGVGEQIPFYRTFDDVATGLESKDKFSDWAGRFTKGVAEPRIVQEIAEWTDPMDDKHKRSPKGFGQQMESGIPGLRENVPMKRK